MAIEDGYLDTVDVKSVAKASDGKGGITETWSTVVANYKCRFMGSTRAALAGVEEPGLLGLKQYQVNGGYDASITVGMRIVKGSVNYKILRIVEQRSKKSIPHHLLMVVEEETPG